MRVLIACEYSGVVRDAFIAAGHEALSCDLLDSDTPGPHHKGNVLEILGDGWNLMIAHPPCTYLAVSGARWFREREREQAEALVFVHQLLSAPISKIALENPISVISSKIRKPDQIIQPWMFGHPEFKATCLWLKNLPPLRPTNTLAPPARGTDEHKLWSKVHRAAPGPDRWKIRSKTYNGIADAMAAQWGILK